MKYKIGFLTWKQEELTWRQDKQIAALVKNLATHPEDEISFNGMIELLNKHNMVGVFLGIILKPKHNIQFFIWKIWFTIKWIFNVHKGYFTQVEFDKATNSVIGQIYDDFFYSTRS